MQDEKLSDELERIQHDTRLAALRKMYSNTEGNGNTNNNRDEGPQHNGNGKNNEENNLDSQNNSSNNDTSSNQNASVVINITSITIVGTVPPSFLIPILRTIMLKCS